MEMATEHLHGPHDLEANRKTPETSAPEMAAGDHAFAPPIAGTLGAAGGAAPIQRSVSLIASPVMRSPAGRGLRDLVFRQAQQGYGNRFTQRVVRHQAATIQRQCACGGTCEKCQAAGSELSAPEPRQIQRQAAAPNASRTPSAAVIPESSRGEPLDEATMADMGTRFGRDFADVRVHRDGDAAASSQLLQADAYTTGRDVYFAAGKYQPGTHQGRSLLAHELTHVVQQSDGATPSSTLSMHAADGVVVGHPDDPLEREAEHTADRVMAGGHAEVASAGAPEGAVQRQPQPDAPAAAADAATTISDAIKDNNVGAAVPPLRNLSVKATFALRDTVHGKTNQWMERWLLGRQNRAKNIATAKTVATVAAGLLAPATLLGTAVSALIPKPASAENGTAEEGLRLLWPALPLLDRLEIYNEWHREIEQAQIDTIRFATPAERKVAREDSRRLEVYLTLMNSKEEYEARVLLDESPEGKYAAAEKLIERGGDKDVVYDSIMALDPTARRKVFDAHFLQLNHLLSTSEFLLISQLTKASEAQALIIRLRLATEGRIDDMDAVKAAVDRAVELLKERRQLRAVGEARGLTDKDRQRLKELEDLDTLLEFHRDSKGELDPKSFMGMLAAARGDAGAFGADTRKLAEFATDKRKYAFEAGKQRILLAGDDKDALRAAIFSIHAPAVEPAAGARPDANAAAQHEADIKLRGEVLDDREVQKAINGLTDFNRRLVLDAKGGDAFDEALSELGDLQNSAQWGAFFDLVLRIASTPGWRERFDKTSTDPFGVYARTHGDERDIMLAILTDGRIPLTAVLKYTGNVATLRAAFANIPEKDRAQLRLGWSLARQPITKPLTDEQEKALKAFQNFEAELRKSQTRWGSFDAAGFEAVLGTTLGSEPTADDLKTGEGRYRAASIWAERVDQRLAVDRGISTYFTETDETMEAAGRQFAALWLRVKEQHTLEFADYALLGDLYKKFDARAEEFTESSKAITDMAGTIAATIAGIAVIAATGGAATPLVIAGAAAAGLGGGIVTRQAFGGGYYNALNDEGLRDMLLDSINGALSVISGGLAARGVELIGLSGRALTQGAARIAGSVVEEATQTFANKVAASAVESAIDGLISGAASEGFSTMTDDRTWRKGIMEGIARIGHAALLGGLTGLAGGAALGAALPVAERGVSKLWGAIAGQSIEKTLARAGLQDVLQNARDAALRGDLRRMEELAIQLEGSLSAEEGSLMRQQLRDIYAERFGHPPGTAIAEGKQKILLHDAGGVEDGALLTTEQKAAEMDIVRQSEPQVSHEAGYVDEVDLGNGHTWRRREDGTWCRFTKQTLCGTKIPGVKPPSEAAKATGTAAYTPVQQVRQDRVDDFLRANGMDWGDLFRSREEVQHFFSSFPNTDEALSALERKAKEAATLRAEIRGGLPVADPFATPPSTREIREAQPGFATGGRDLPPNTGRLFDPKYPGRVTHIPGQLAAKMRNAGQFRNWRQFRETFWRFMSEEPGITAFFKPDNVERMSRGLAPFVETAERTGGGSNAVLNLDHVLALENGGALYDLDNIQIVTPVAHQTIGTFQ